ncbi:MAG: DUF2283 domain-containing protein [Candidatus Bathyarchaeia archaeon]
MASLRFDPKANALYVRIAEGRVAETEPLNDSMFVDLDGDGRVLGIEVILPKDLPKRMTKKIAEAIA